MIVLASNSPRRKELLSKYITNDFVVCASHIDEMSSFTDPCDIVKDLAKQKGSAVYKNHNNDTIISCDTLVVLNNKIFGKPHGEKEAKAMLTELSGKTHKVITGYYIKNKDMEINDVAISFVTFKELTSEVIQEYINTGSPFDKAGGYGIQDSYCKNIIKSYDGSLTNIIGFPTEKIKEVLLENKIII